MTKRARMEDLGLSSNKNQINYPGDAGISQRQPTKKLVIRTFKVKPKLPDNFEEVTWAKLQAAVWAIHTSKPVNDSLEELYKACENLCLHKMADRLYQRLQKECESHIIEELAKLRSNESDKETFLVAVNQCWNDCQQQMALIRSIFLYLDRTYVLQNSSIISLWDMGLELFRKHIMSAVDVRGKTLDGLLSVIHRERLGESVDRSLLVSLIHMYVDLSIYTQGFEAPFLQDTHDFYAEEGQRLMNTLEVPKYLEHVKRRLDEEKDRIIVYLDKKTKTPLIGVVEGELLERHISAILDKGFDDMMNYRKSSDLRLLYMLFNRVNASDRLKTAFGMYIRKTGAGIVMDESRDSTMVQDLLDLKFKLDDIVKDAFKGTENFVNTVKESFESFINQRQNKPAELIAKYVDSKLRSGNKSMNDDELESVLDNVLILFRYIQGKDIFEAFYKRDLAKRLLLNRSASSDAEKSMLSKLKQECGAGFTGKLEGMFKDIDLSRDIMMSFQDSKYWSELKETRIDLSVNVLTQGFWPTYPPAPLTLPPHMARAQEVFKAFYLSKHNGRNLKWQNSLGLCVLAANFPKRNKELVVSLFQAVVLLLFNDLEPGKRLTYEDIKESTSIEARELARTLQSLACGKVRVLTKHPKGRDIAESDEFSFNEEFDDKLFRIKINAIQLKETPEENSITTERVFLDRQYQVDAALVRIMKMRKTLSHSQLITELFQQLKFKATVADIKKRIESLIDREYLERDKDDPSKLNYLA
ncbi:588_t:CDS:10 [Paraglomus occultum]|uniref:Cullin-4 n=1 Tax=Paraglomus occultum TaxID=144539 RepID=A0A9N9BD51_9GLOM|nr:588_t:CDS:10 [Paraglomus occultum]